MRKQGELVRLFFVVFILSALLSACASEPVNTLEGYDYRGIGIGDTREALIDTFGDPESIEEESMYSIINYADAVFILKTDEIISIGISREFTLPSGVAINDSITTAIEMIGEEQLLQEPDNSMSVYQLLDDDYAIALSFAEEEGVLYEDSSINSITISHAKEMLAVRNIDYTEFKENLVPVKYQERTATDQSSVLQTDNADGLTVLDIVSDYWKTADNTTYYNFSSSTDTKFIMAVCTNGNTEQYTGAITLDGTELLSVIIENKDNTTKSHTENYEITKEGHVIREYPNSEKQLLIPSVEEQFISCSNAISANYNEIEYSQQFYGRWVRVDVLEENSSIYIELDEWDRGVLEFNNEGESFSYMMYATERSDEGTLAEYEDESGITHQVSMTIQNDKLLIAIDSEFVGAYERAQ